MTEIDSITFSDPSLDNVTSLLTKEVFKISQEEFKELSNLFNGKLACPYVFFREIEDYDRPINET